MKILRSSQELSGVKRDMRIHTGCGERLKGGRKGEEGGGGGRQVKEQLYILMPALMVGFSNLLNLPKGT